MSQLNIYVPEPVEKKIKTEAKKRRLSVSAFVAELLQRHFNGEKKDKWDKDFFSLAGAWHGDFPEITREVPQDRVDS